MAHKVDSVLLDQLTSDPGGGVNGEVWYNSTAGKFRCQENGDTVDLVSGNAARGRTWTFDTTTTDADPGNGFFRLNNSTQASATFAYVDDVSTNGVSLRDVLLALRNNDYLYLQESIADSRYHLYRVTGTPTAATGYVKIPIVSVSAGGALRNNKKITGSLFPVNAAGTGDVSGPASATDNALTRFDGTGGKTIQNSGATLNDSDQLAAVETCTFNAEHDNGNQAGPSWTLDWNNGQKQRVTLTGNTTTLTITAPPGPGNFILRVIQDGTGSRTITWPSSVKWPGGTAPTLSTGANAIDIVTMYYDGTNYYSAALLGFA